MRDLMSKAKVPLNVGGETPATGSLDSSVGQVDKEKKRLLDFANDDTCSAILETSFLRLLKKEKMASSSSFERTLARQLRLVGNGLLSAPSSVDKLLVLLNEWCPICPFMHLQMMI